MAILDLFELDHNDPDKISIPLNFASVDFRDIGSRKGSFSRTIKLPSTKANDAFFGLSFEVTNEGLFDDKIKIPISINRIEFLGFMQLNGVSISEGKTDSYSVNIFSDLVDWTALIGAGSLRDLTTLGSHVYSLGNIEDSWNHSPLTDEYVYPLIDYGNYLDNSPLRIAGTNDVPNDNIFMELEDWYPAFFVLPIIKKIFGSIGYKFLGEYVEGEELVNLILPFVGEELDVTVSTVDVSQDTSVSRSLIDNPQFLYSTPSTIQQTFVSRIEMSTIATDPGNNYNLSTDGYIAPDDGDYNISVGINVKLTGHKDVLGLPLNTYLYMGKGAAAGGWSTFTVGGTYDITQAVQSGDSSFTNIIGSTTVSLKKGDVISLSIATQYLSGSFTSLEFTHGGMTIDQVLTERQGGLLEHNKVVQDIKKIDLLKDVISEGNYRIITDTKSKTVDFIPESAFLGNSPKDWTHKKDNSRKIDISLIRNDGAKSLIWDYSNDNSDSLLDNARVHNSELIIGRSEITMESEHRKGVQNVYKSIFSSTFDGKTLGLDIPKMKNESDEFVVTAVANKASTNYPKGSLDTGVKSTNFSNRILLWGGTKAGTFFNNGVQHIRYPYSYFTKGSFTLSYGDMIADGGRFGTRTVRGLVVRNYIKTIKRLNESKMLKGYFWLDEYDISTLDFGRPIIVNDVQYYINKVIDYRVGANQPTQVELISRV